MPQLASFNSTRARAKVTVHGSVQGVGFRPFVHCLATGLGLTGWVLNSSAGLVIEVEGETARVDEFLCRLEREKPAAAVVQEMLAEWLAPAGYERFEIHLSQGAEPRTAGVPADLAACAECMAELRDAGNRRYGYAFTNCTNCGPRYTIVHDIPYDRASTTMRSFDMCEACRREYEDPENRRFHAQPNACPVCGPKLTEVGIVEAAAALLAGRIVALKGIGGFQLLCDARNEQAVALLRERKGREAKPFAVMVASISMARTLCVISGDETRVLESPAAPIVLLRPSVGHGLASNVSPDSPYVGVMLPYSPLHHLLMREAGFPVVATSGNRSDEPIATGNEEAMERLGGIADVFVMHNRPIARPCDDSVVRVSGGNACVIRRARGYAPLPVPVNADLPNVLAVGGHLKNTVAIAMGRQVVLSQHIGDLETLEAREAFERAIEDLCRLYDWEPALVACDLHPSYASTIWAEACGLPLVRVQHHHAHVAACAAENGVSEPYLGVAWDGSGYGTDRTIWGGEFFHVERGEFQRVAHLRPFRLPGSEAAIREGWRVAASLLVETFGIERLDESLMPDRKLLSMLERDINSPVTTSVGRLFDAMAALSGVARRSLYEGQAAMSLESAIGSLRTNEAYPFEEGDWAPMIECVVTDARRGVDRGIISARFHNALANWIACVAKQVGVQNVVLSGGVFQNSYLTERSVEELRCDGFSVHTHRMVPANDGGIALGQAVIAGRSY
jgi:hydrogenase maturation protein HypF